MTHYSRTLTSEAHYDDRSCARPLFRPAFWFRIAVADPGGCVTGMITPPPLNLSRYWKPMQSVCDRDRSPPPPWNVDDVTRAMSKGGGCLWMSSPPPPFRKSCIRAWIGTPQKLYPISPTDCTCPFLTWHSYISWDIPTCVLLLLGSACGYSIIGILAAMTLKSSRSTTKGPGTVIKSVCVEGGGIEPKAWGGGAEEIWPRGGNF